MSPQKIEQALPAMACSGMCPKKAANKGFSQVVVIEETNTTTSLNHGSSHEMFLTCL